MKKKIIVVGGGNAALCAGIAALEKGAEVTLLEKAPEHEAGGNSRYTAGAMRFAYNTKEDILPLLTNPDDPKIALTDFGKYSKEMFEKDLLSFNDGRSLRAHQKYLIEKSYETLKWLGTHNIKFDPIYSRQAFKKAGKYIFWGGLILEAKGEGVGLIDAEIAEFKQLGGRIKFEVEATELLKSDDAIIGLVCKKKGIKEERYADAIILACGGFEANPDMRGKYMGKNWEKAKVRGTKHNTGNGLNMALEAGAALAGKMDGCHAVPMDRHMPDYGGENIPFIERKKFRKICYFLGVMLNANGERFVDEGINFRNYTYAQYGRKILEQPGGFAWQIFDSKIEPLLYDEYRFEKTGFVEAHTLEELVTKLSGVNSEKALETLRKFNESVDQSIKFEPAILDGRRTQGLNPEKTNWANAIDTPPFKAYPVICGITFTYGGLSVDQNGAVLDANKKTLKNLYACGELVGGIFFNGYPGGSGLTSGAVFGRLAGFSASKSDL